MLGPRTSTDQPARNAVLTRLSRLANLSQHELNILRGLPARAQHYPAEAELCPENQVQHPLMLLSGWACYQRVLGDGRRQIVQILLPGDAIGFLSHPNHPAPCTAMALTPVTAADARPLLRDVDEGGVSLSGLAEARTMMAQAHAIRLDDQIVRLGRQNAYERLLHLFLELKSRLEVVGMVDGDRFHVPLNQQMLSDALGLSVIHVSRTLQQVRRDRLLTMRGGWVTLYRRDAVRSIADGAILTG